MSKNNKKQKKGQTTSGVQQAFQLQRRQLLDCQFTIKKLQQRLDDLTQQKARFKKKLDQADSVYNQSIEELTIKNSANEKRLLGLSNQRTKLQIENQKKEKKIKLLQKNLFDQQQGRIKDLQQCKKNFHFQLAKYQSQLSEYKLYMNQRDDIEQERQDLRQKIQMEKANKLRQIADKQRQKVQATDKLKDQMLHKINDMRKNLFSLKRQQLSTTTRLTMLQNHQLTSELQYQSKQTQKLIFKNQQLQQKINSLKQELEIHKQVEQQLAKRSHFSKGVIRKLNLKINQLQQQIQKMKNEMCLLPEAGQNIHSSINSGLNKNKLTEEEQSQKNSINQTKNQLSNLNNKRLISTLQIELQKSEKKYVQLLNSYQSLDKHKQSLQIKLRIGQEKANQLFKLMKKYYDQILMTNQDKFNQIQENQNKISPDGDIQGQTKQNNTPYQYNLSHLRSIPIQSWKNQDIVLTVQILLNLIQPYMTKANMVIPSVKKNIILADSYTTRKSDLSSKSLPKLTTQRKQIYQNKVQQMPINIASKIVGSNLRDWGQSIKLNKTCLSRKYKVAQSFRG